jgi:dCMP deaminase
MPGTSSAARTPRPSWDDFFLGQLAGLAARATCDRGRSAALFVRDGDQLAAGYVGAPPGFAHCDDVGHLLDDAGRHCVRTIHAEQNAVIRAVRNGVSLCDSTLYCTMEPCADCAMTALGIGVHRVVVLHGYHGAARTRAMFAEAGVVLVVRNSEELYDPGR